ncbi:MAG: hypothetical protein QM820_47535 [Minicystis sp.]
MRRPLAGPAFALALCASAAVSDAQTAAADPAARGLDLFLHAPDGAAPGSRVPVQIEAFGFPTAVTLAPLGGATVEAAWDPEHLGPGVTAAPPAVRATTDAAGRAHLDVPVPEGDERPLVLLVGLRAAGHERTRTITVKRGAAHAVGLHVADTRVVPGSSVSAWVLVTRASTGAPAAGAPVELALVEGGLPRFTAKLVTDAAGTAMARVPIPEADEPSWTWTLRARSLGAGEQASGEAEVRLAPREETPGTPRLSTSFDGDAILAGDKAPFTLRVRDANDLPIAGLPVRWWVGPKGTEPPKDADWNRLTKLGSTDAEGEVHGSTDAPSLVVAGVGTSLRLVARTEVEGHALSQSTTVSVGVPASTATLTPEAGTIVPGVEQRLLLRVRDGHGKAIAATFAVEGDGLAATVTTDAAGEAEVTWKPPVDVGAQRNVGPCAGGVAAAVVVRPQGEVPALKPRRDPFELCLSVNREANAIVRVDRPIARTGDRVRVRILEAPAVDEKGRAVKAEDGAKRAWSVVLRSGKGEQAASAWIEDGEKGGEIRDPARRSGRVVDLGRGPERRARGARRRRIDRGDPARAAAPGGARRGRARGAGRRGGRRRRPHRREAPRPAGHGRRRRGRPPRRRIHLGPGAARRAQLHLPRAQPLGRSLRPLRRGRSRARRAPPRPARRGRAADDGAGQRSRRHRARGADQDLRRGPALARGRRLRGHPVRRSPARRAPPRPARRLHLEPRADDPGDCGHGSAAAHAGRRAAHARRSAERRRAGHLRQRRPSGHAAQALPRPRGGADVAARAAARPRRARLPRSQRAPPQARARRPDRRGSRSSIPGAAPSASSPRTAPCSRSSRRSAASSCTRPAPTASSATPTT